MPPARVREDARRPSTVIPLKGTRPVNVPDFREVLDLVHFGSVMVDAGGIIKSLRGTNLAGRTGRAGVAGQPSFDRGPDPG